MEKKLRALATVAYAILALMLAGCASTPPQSSTPPAPPAAAPGVVSRVVVEPAAQPAPPPNPACSAKPPSAPPAISSKPGYTQVHVSALDGTGQPVRGLQQSAFTVSSAGQPLPVIYFHEDSNGIPKSVVITIDTSGSMQPKLEDVRTQIRKLIDGLNTCDDVALIAFSSRPFLLQGPTTDHPLVKERLALLHAMGPTALYDAVVTSVRVFDQAKYPGHVLILVTDGMDNVSHTSTCEALNRVAFERVQVYAIGIGDPSVSLYKTVFGNAGDSLDKAVLDQIATGTGGIDFIVRPMNEDRGESFSRAVSSVSAALGPGYEVGFTVPAPETSRDVTVSVAQHANYVIHLTGAPPASKVASPITAPQPKK